jgi:2-polyprenyl-3-methyl-5-hydroxy-6-metoxy-1,4-benzoquinol methylase
VPPANDPIVSVTGPPLRPLDRFIRWWRIRKVRRFFPRGATVLDVGCHDGALFRNLRDRLAGGVGIDPLVERSGSRGRFTFVSGTFPDDLAREDRFDVITLLAVLEHVPPDLLHDWSEACRHLLTPGGLVIATVPSPVVDGVLHLLTRARLVAGMSVEEHHGFDPSSVPDLFASEDLGLIRHERFELGMNNLFVFRSTQPARAPLTTEPA